MRAAWAIFLALLGHVALIGGIWLYSGGAGTETAELVVEAPAGSVFVGEIGKAEVPLAAAAAAPAAVAAPLADSQAARSEAGPAATAPSPGKGGEAEPIGILQPEYPAMSRKLGEQGEAIFVLHLDANGAVTSADLEHTSGHDRLDDAARTALLAARFRTDGQGNSTKKLRVEFRLTDPAK